MGISPTGSKAFRPAPVKGHAKHGMKGKIEVGDGHLSHRFQRLLDALRPEGGVEPDAVAVSSGGREEGAGGDPADPVAGREGLGGGGGRGRGPGGRRGRRGGRSPATRASPPRRSPK